MGPRGPHRRRRRHGHLGKRPDARRSLPVMARIISVTTPPAKMSRGVGLPAGRGEAVAGELRTRGSIPIVSLTAKAGEEDRIRGLEMGADDYVTKPFSPRELVLRCQAILRRGGQPAGGNFQPSRYG